MGVTVEERQQLALLRPGVVVFIPCGKAKRVGVHEVHRLYIGSYFRLCLTVARRLTDDSRIFVLSAKHGVLKLSQRIGSYNVKITDLTKDERSEWTSKVLRVMMRLPQPIVLCCGENYSKGLPGIRLLPSRLKGIGYQVQYLQSLLKNELRVRERLEDL